MFLAWVIEIAKTFAFALGTSVLFLCFRALMLSANQKGTGISVLRANIYSLMLAALLQILLAVLLSQVDIMYYGGGMHLALIH
jgi:cbb3-type cytochrome oxidase subunit 3